MPNALTHGGEGPVIFSRHPPHGTPLAGDVAAAVESLQLFLGDGGEVERLSGFHRVCFVHMLIIQQKGSPKTALVPLPQLSQVQLKSTGQSSFEAKSYRS